MTSSAAIPNPIATLFKRADLIFTGGLFLTVLVLTRLMPPEKVRPDALLNPVHDVSPTKRYATENCTVPVTVLLLLLTPKRPPPKIRSSEISVVFACVVRVPESV